MADTLCRAALIFNVQSWLGESEETQKNSSTPGYVSVGMAREYSVRNVETLDKQRVLTDWF